MHFKMQFTTLKYLKKVAKTCEKVLRLNKKSSRTFLFTVKESKQLLTSISVDIRIYLPLKVIFALALQLVSLFWEDKSSCLPH